MLLWIRMITLVAFALHAVLGCFLLHGHGVHGWAALGACHYGIECCEGEHQSTVEQACGVDEDSLCCHHLQLASQAQSMEALPATEQLKDDGPCPEGCPVGCQKGTCVYVEGLNPTSLAHAKSMIAFQAIDLAYETGVYGVKSIQCDVWNAWKPPVFEPRRAYLQVWRI
ncbi:MAG: hypothetical protein U0905_02710 [Pirellulales bacterium]